MSIKILLPHVACAVALAATTALGLATGADDAPREQEPNVVVVDLDCPEEDSCDVDYRDGRWYVYQTNR